MWLWLPRRLWVIRYLTGGHKDLTLPMRKSIKCSVIVRSVLTNTAPFCLCIPSPPSGEHHLCFFYHMQNYNMQRRVQHTRLVWLRPTHMCHMPMRPTQVLCRDCSNNSNNWNCNLYRLLLCVLCCVLCCTSLWFINKRQSLFMNFRFQFNGTERERPQRYRYIEPRSSHHHPYGLNCMNYFDKIQNTAQWR